MPNNPNFGQGLPSRTTHPSDPPQLPPSAGTRSRLLTHPRSTIAEGMLFGAAYIAAGVTIVRIIMALLQGWAAA